jgi:hypothetical protein
MDFRVPVNERQVLTLLHRELRLGPFYCDTFGRRLVGELVEKSAEPITDRVKNTLHLAIVAMIRLGGYAPKKIVNVVQIQADDEFRARWDRLLECACDFGIQERLFYDQVAFAGGERDREPCARFDMFPTHS